MHSWCSVPWAMTLLVTAALSRPLAHPDPQPQPLGGPHANRNPYRPPEREPYEECISMWDLLEFIESFGGGIGSDAPYWNSPSGDSSRGDSGQPGTEDLQTGAGMGTGTKTKTKTETETETMSDASRKEQEPVPSTSSLPKDSLEREMRWRKREQECFKEALGGRRPPTIRYWTEQQARDAGVLPAQPMLHDSFERDSSSSFWASRREREQKEKPYWMSFAQRREVNPSSMVHYVRHAVQHAEIPKVDLEHVWRWMGTVGAVAASRGGSSRAVIRWRPV